MEKPKEKMPLKQRKKGERGITLIALVITIIVLLILAAVSIATLTGQNGILSRTDDAKKENEIASVKEQARLDISNYVAEKLINGEDSTVNTPEKVQEILEAANQNNENKYYKGFTETGITTPSGYEVPYEELYTTGSKGEEETPKTAGEVLKVNPEAKEAKDKSPYVKYNNMLCRVLYNDAEHGIQIVTADNGVVSDVTLGYGDDKVTAADFIYDGSATVDDNFKKAAASYNNVVDNLNERAVEYMDKKGIAKGARSLGSIATLENGRFQGDTSGMFTGTYRYFTTYKWNEKFKVADTNYKEDVEQLNNLELNATGYTWLASRNITSNTVGGVFIVRYVFASNSLGTLGGHNLCNVVSDGSIRKSSRSSGFRPVFLLTSDVVISSGEGSNENPYVIE